MRACIIALRPIVAACVAGLTSASAFAADPAPAPVRNWNFGPVEAVNQYFLSTRELGGSALSPSPAGENNLDVGATAAWTNTFDRKPGRYLADGEVVQTMLGMDYGVTDTVTLNFRLPLEVRSGGVLDNPIDNFHNAFDLPTGGRETEPHDQFLISGRLDDDSLFLADDEGFVVPQLTTGATFLLTSGDDSYPAQAIRAGIRVPLESDTLHDESFGLLVDWILSKRFGPVWLYGTASAGGYTERRVGAFEERQLQLAAALACEVSITEHIAATLGVWSSSQAVTNVLGLPDADLYLDVGATVELAKGSELEFLFRQNPETTGTADVTFLVGISKRVSL